MNVSPRTTTALAALALAFTAACGGKTPAPAPAAPPPAPAPPPAAEQVDPRYAALPEPTPAVDWTPPHGTHFTLKNGIRVWHLEHGSTPLVSLQVVIPRGAAADPEDLAGLTYLLADMLDEGAGKRSALELSDELGLLATDYEATAGVDYMLLGMNLLAENLEASVALLSDILRRPRLPKDEFERRKHDLLAQIIASEAQPRATQSVAVHRVLFGSGYAGFLPRGTRQSVEAITYRDLKNHHQRMIAPEGIEIVTVGGVSEDRVRQVLEEALGDWQGKARVEARAVAPAPERLPIYVVHYPGAAQSALTVAKRAAGANAPDYFPGLVANRPIGESFTSRINLNLREEKGYTYGARSDIRRYRQAGYFGVSTNVRTDVTRASLDEIFRELGELCTKRPLTQAERDEAVSGLLLGYPATFERVDQVAMRLASVPIYDRPVDFWQTWPDRVEAVGVEEANALAQTLCDPSEYVIVIAGDHAAIEGDLAGLGREIVELDRSGNIQAPAPKEGPTGPGAAPR
ncbi:MAG: insulinase family protein [Myxococcales bacterium]|nr:insulinase family protein [Myxococcales bacterium]